MRPLDTAAIKDAELMDQVKKNLDEIVKFLGGKDEAVRFLEEQKDERLVEILSIEMMIATIQGVH
jgi:predicted RNA-binding protein with EMAP domain